MKIMPCLIRLVFFTLFGFMLSCVSSTEKGAIGVDRKQLLLVPSEQIVSMSAQAYEQTKAEAAQAGKLDQRPDQVQRVKQIAQKLIPQTANFRTHSGDWKWEVHIISSEELNAYCMPGGKIMFYTGIIDKLNLTDAEIAAIMGHEMSHALREHGRERMSEELIKQTGISLLVASGRMDAKYAEAANLITAVTVSLRHSRTQESEADAMGVELMARAGFDPHAAISLWKKMSSQGGGKPPEFLSTHPADETRIARIEALLPKVMPLYQGSQNK